MEKVRVIHNGIEKKLDYTFKIAHGIFIVEDNKPVLQNCAQLNIDLEENIDPNELKQKVSKFEKTGILTTRILGRHFQYILKDYADKADVEELIRKTPQASQEALRTTYNLTKMENVNDLDFLGGALDNKN